MNGQSGKGGIAFVLEHEYGLQLPRPMQVELRKSVQAVADRLSCEMDPARLRAMVRELFEAPEGLDRYVRHRVIEAPLDSTQVEVRVEFERQGVLRTERGTGTRPVEAFASALGELQVADYYETASSSGDDAGATAVVYVAVLDPDGAKVWGMGLDAAIVTASLKAMLAARNRMQAATCAGIGGRITAASPA